MSAAIFMSGDGIGNRIEEDYVKGAAGTLDCELDFYVGNADEV